ncbi:uncharacterized protein LOC134787172 [Penaeus indicus]|uniref:uncharacterized protein LOC134787172 n=1 Tax=Penaeus indicus TaxID=29960 RepID=UPI00300CB786
MGALRAFVAVFSLAVMTGAQRPLGLQFLEDAPTVTPSLLTTLPMSEAGAPKSEDIEEHLLADKNRGVTEITDQDQNLQDIREKIMSTMPSSDQAEVTTEEEMLGQVSTVTPTPEPLPTPLPVLISMDGAEGILKSPDVEKPVGKKKSSVPKKGVAYEPSSVVPKKSADPESVKPSVVPKKGVDSEDSKPSVVPKKGVDLENLKPSVVPKKGVDLENLKPSVVPKKGVDSENLKPSVVPKKGVDSENLKPSVVPKKGVDSESSKSSVVPKKGVDTGLVKPIVSEANMQITTQKDPTVVKESTVSDSSAVVPKKSMSNPSSSVNALPSSLQEKPTPSLISPTKPLKGSPTPSPVQPTVHLAGQNESSNSTKSESIPPSTDSSESHSKPTAAIDNLDAKEKDSEGSGAYTPAAVGIILLLCIVITVMILGIRRLQDVWMRRHYARVDFLIDGMYDM